MAPSSNGRTPDFQSENASSILAGATMNVELFPAMCFGIPIVSFLHSVIRDKGYMEGWREGRQEIEMPKKTVVLWRTREGHEISLEKMEDTHLVNAIKMVARNCNKTSYLGDMKDDSNFKKLLKEAKRRKFKVSILNHPVSKDGRLEYVDIWTPIPRSKLSVSMRPTDWESRPME